MSTISKPRTVLLSGATSGIGEAICDSLLAANHRVIGLGRNVDKLRDKHELLQAWELDLSNPDAVPKLLTKLIKDYEAEGFSIDTFIASAGYGQFGSLEQFSYKQMRQIMDVNFLSQANITRALLPEFKRAGLADIVFIGSEAALAGGRKGAMYCASKFALRGFAQALREECAKSDVRICTINPGMVDTPFFEELDFAPGEDDTQHIRAKDIADAVMMVLNQPRGTVVDEINLSPLKKVMRNK